jgi:hypothetical protein
MDEADFWGRLEYRICAEIEGLKAPVARGFWCDGLIPVLYQLHEPAPRIVGSVWMGVGPKHQEEWEFVLVLPSSVESRERIEWSAQLPASNLTRWLTIDAVAKRLIVEPAVAVHDAS